MRPATPVRATVLAALAALGVLAAAGCGAIDETRQVLDRADLVDELASRLDRASELTYTAQYQLPGGETATIAQAQRPVRSAYSYPGGKVVISDTATAECSAALCTLTAKPLSTSGPPPGVLAAARARGLVHPTFVMGLLTTAALDNDARIEQSDTTIAGQHATCVDVAEVENAVPPAFATCITTDGMLGSFSGEVDGRLVEVSLTGVSDTAAPTAFDLPAGAQVTDRRPR
jgi:hypothetical protein